MSSTSSCTVTGTLCMVLKRQNWRELVALVHVSFLAFFVSVQALELFYVTSRPSEVYPPWTSGLHSRIGTVFVTL